MTRIELDITKSVDENASIYFDKAKKLKKKLAGLTEAMEKKQAELNKLILKKDKEMDKQQEQSEKTERKKEWFEKFRWFNSSEGFLCLGGRDATSNEIVIKKHTDKDDVVFHTDMAGSPFFVIKTEGKKPGKATMQEVADSTASFSRGWRKGLSTMDVFYVNPEQVSKTAKSGEFMPKGAFMITGKTNYITPQMKVAVGINKKGAVMAGGVSAIEKNCEKSVKVIQGSQKTSAVAKLIRKIIGGELDDIIRALPSGGCKVEK